MAEDRKDIIQFATMELRIALQNGNLEEAAIIATNLHQLIINNVK